MGGSPRFWGWHGALMSPPCLLLRGDGLSQATRAAQPAAVRPTEGAAVPALRPALGDTGGLGDAAVTGHGDGRRESPLSVAVTTCCLRAPVGREAGPWQRCLADEASPLRCPDGGGPGDTRALRVSGELAAAPPGGFAQTPSGTGWRPSGMGPGRPTKACGGAWARGPAPLCLRPCTFPALPPEGAVAQRKPPSPPCQAPASVGLGSHPTVPLAARTPGPGDTGRLVEAAADTGQGPATAVAIGDTRPPRRGRAFATLAKRQRGPIPRAEGALAGPAGTEAPLCEVASRLAKERSPGTVTYPTSQGRLRPTQLEAGPQATR